MENSKIIIRSKDLTRRGIERVEVTLKNGKGIVFFNVKNVYYSERENNMWMIVCEQETTMIAREEIKTIKIIYQRC